MRRHLAFILAALLMALGLVAVNDSPADAHLYPAADVCYFGEIGHFGAEPNEVRVDKSTSFHFYGLSYYKCCYVSLRYGFRVMALYLEGWDEWSWPTGDPWCPGS